jgi:hypothetical protein
MRRIDQSTEEEDLQRRPPADRQNPSMEYIAGAIEVRCWADGVFGQDSILKRLASPATVGLVASQRHESHVQCPDLLVYKPDFADWFFCEVKGPKDRLREEQIRYFRGLASALAKESLSRSVPGCRQAEEVGLRTDWSGGSQCGHGEAHAWRGHPVQE